VITNQQAISQPLPANWQEKHDRMLFHRDTRSKTKITIKAPAYLEHYSVVQLTQKTAKKKRKLMSGHVQQFSWKLRGRVGSSADEDNDDDETSYLAALTDHAAYSRWQGFPELLFLEYVSQLDESEVQERLNRISLPVSLWIHISHSNFY
jgi:hypothetical protein